MLTERQKRVLKFIVERYVDNALPVGSKHICEELDCSSATIRNEMAFLERIGYIEKTHTSSGRIPSEVGYRYYVDNLMQAREITGETMLKLQRIFSNTALELNSAVRESMKIIADITHYTSIVLESNNYESKLKSVKIVPLNSDQAVALVITDKGHVENKTIMIPKTVDMYEVEKTVDLINELVVGTPLSQVCFKLEFDIKPIIGNYVRQHQDLYRAFVNAFNDYKSSQDVYFSGKTNLLDQPEFDNVDKMKKFVRVLEDENINHFIEHNDNEINIKIGTENDLSEDCTLITTKYNINGEEGTIAVLGPKRMEYSKVVSLLQLLKDNLNKY